MSLLEDLSNIAASPTIEASEDPRERSYMEVYSHWKANREHYRDTKAPLDELDAFYPFAKKLLKKHVRKNSLPQNLFCMYENNKHRQDNLAGYFISAAFNLSPASMLIVPTHLPEIDYLGYKLKENKTIFSYISTFGLGTQSKGNIVNFGDACHFAKKAKGGIYINKATAYWLGADAARDSLFIDYNPKGGIPNNFSNCIKVNFSDDPEECTLHIYYVVGQGKLRGESYHFQFEFPSLRNSSISLERSLAYDNTVHELTCALPYPKDTLQILETFLKDVKQDVPSQIMETMKKRGSIKHFILQVIDKPFSYLLHFSHNVRFV